MERADVGRLRTSKGRMLRTDGDDNDHIELPGECFDVANPAARGEEEVLQLKMTDLNPSSALFLAH